MDTIAWLLVDRMALTNLVAYTAFVDRLIKKNIAYILRMGF
jgi:hypothetical protein